jgi:hypothetical protein
MATLANMQPTRPNGLLKATLKLRELTIQNYFRLWLIRFEFVNYFDVECDHVDIKAAFLNGELEETIYLRPPEGFEHEIAPGKVLKLDQSLYGLEQSHKCFNRHVKVSDLKSDAETTDLYRH